MYIYHNTQIDEYEFYTNLKLLCENLGLKYNTFSNIFSRQKKHRYNGHNFVIVKRVKK
jgi:hypothetical protein